VYEEVSPFRLRNVLRASRAICVNRQRVGGIVVRARLDYRSLPFGASTNPYLESLMPQNAVAGRTRSAADVELAFYGWSRAPIYASGTKVWPLDDTVFEKMIESRDATWQRVVRDGVVFRVYFFNDRGGIYALGYPVITWLGHLINLGELLFFCGTLYSHPAVRGDALQSHHLPDSSERSGAPPRSSLELLPQAVHRLRRFVGGAGRRARRCDEHLLREPVPRRRRRSRGQEPRRLRSGSSRITSRCSSEAPDRSIASTTSSCCSCGAPSTKM
jgi:hypothetical protein